MRRLHKIRIILYKIHNRIISTITFLHHNIFKISIMYLGHESYHRESRGTKIQHKCQSVSLGDEMDDSGRNQAEADTGASSLCGRGVRGKPEGDHRFLLCLYPHHGQFLIGLLLYRYHRPVSNS